MPLVGCSETTGDGGSGGSAETGGNGGSAGSGGAGGIGGDGGSAGSGGAGGMGGDGGAGGGMGDVFPCTEQGIRDAIAKGGGPHYFACDDSTPVMTSAQIEIDSDVILDGQGKLTVDGGSTHRVFEVALSVVVELRGMRISGGRGESCRTCEGAGALLNQGMLTLTNCTISENENPGFSPYGVSSPGNIVNLMELTVVNTSVTNNIGGGIYNEAQATVTNSTVSGNTGYGEYNIWPYGIYNRGWASVASSTISGSAAILTEGYTGSAAAIDLRATLIEGECTREGDGVTWTSNGYNVESPGNTCGFDKATDQTAKTTEQLNLGPLADNGGPTMTHKPGDGGLWEGSVAIDVIPVDSCEVAEDQRGQPRPAQRGTLMCDVGSVEVQPARVWNGFAFFFNLSSVLGSVCPGQTVSFMAGTYAANYSCQYGLASCQDYSGYTQIFADGDASAPVWQGGPYLYPSTNSLDPGYKYTYYYPSGDLTAASTPGLHTFTIRVCADGMSKCGMQPSQTTYYGVRSPPTLSDPGPQSGAEGQPLSFSITSSGPGTWNVTGLPPGASVSGDGDTRTFDWTPSTGQAGNYNVTFTLDDCGALADTRNVAIIIGEGQQVLQ